MSRARLALLSAALFMAVVAVLALLTRSNDGDLIMRADPESVLASPQLAASALTTGKRGFVDHCAVCHGEGRGDPRRGMPDLTDGDYLYGVGRVAEIEAIILHGIRSGDSRGWNLADMPAFSRTRPYAREPIPPLTPAQIDDITQYMMQMRGRETDQAAAARGKVLFKGSGACWDCHGPDGGGDSAIGAPNLADDTWLYGDGSAAAIALSITGGRAGRSPAFAGHLSPSDARAIAVYVASLSRHVEKDPQNE